MSATSVSAPWGIVQTFLTTGVGCYLAVTRETDSSPAALTLSVLDPRDVTCSGTEFASTLAGAYLNPEDAVELAAVLMRASGFTPAALMEAVQEQNRRHCGWQHWLDKRCDRYSEARWPTLIPHERT